MNNKKARRIVRKKIEENNIECSVCNSQDFNIEVWDVGSKEPRCAAICEECSSRIYIRADSGGFDTSHF